MDGETLERLVVEAQAGNRHAFGSIFDEYAGPIYRFVVSRVGRPSDAEDLTQLVFVKALEALPRYQARGVPFGGWLFKLARNAVIDHARTHREQVAIEAAGERPADEAGPEAIAVLRDDLDAVAKAMIELTEDQREVIELRFFGGLTIDECSAALSVSSRTAHRHFESARRWLFAQLAGARVA